MGIFCLINKIVMEGPMNLLAAFLQKDFVYSPKWDDEAKRAYQRQWKIKAYIFWFFSLLWFGLCVFFLMVFYANVAQDIQFDFVVTGATYLLEFYFLDTLFLSLFFGFVLFCLICCAPDVVREGINQYLRRGVD